MNKYLHCFSKTTKRGVASLYVVIFATVLFGVITVSFTRIMLSGEDQSSNSDLSQSAYDSALAGVESAKVKIAQYYQALSNNEKPASIFVDFDNTDAIDCGEEMLLQTDANNTSDQAVTCVLISDLVPDYRGTLTPEFSTRMVPIAINETGNDSGTSISQVNKIKISWYSKTNRQDSAFKMSNNNKFLAVANGLVPTLQVTLLRAGATIDTLYMNASSSFASSNTVLDGVYRLLNSTMVFLPSNSGDSNLTVTKDNIINSDDAAKSNTPFRVKCQQETEFACTAILETTKLFKDGDNAFLVLTIPYRNTTTDFMIQLYDTNGNTVGFKGVQLRVDSTGRTNQFFRRVEVRLERTDPYFPYPGYAVELSGTSDFSKNRWYTANCWNTYSLSCPNNGGV